MTKSSSRVQVPDLISTIKHSKSNVVKSEQRASVPAYRRSASETGKSRVPLEKSSSTVDAHVRKSAYQDVKSRYMESSKRLTANNINKDTLKIRARSSSGSSRTSSPIISSSLIRDGNANQSNKKAVNESTTMSRDSLASPAKKGDKMHAHRNASQHQIDHERLSADSLGGSLHSSVITNKTISQESLVKADSRKPSDLKSANKINYSVNNSDKQKQMQVKNVPPAVPPTHGKQAQLKVCSTLLSQNSSTVNSSTPSSMTVKSYLSSSNSINSPRDAVINRLTTPATQVPLKRNAEPKPTMKSFLSARSRQILAQKKSLSHSDSSKSVPAVIKESAANGPSTVNKSSSTSNILNQKTKIAPTTPHLKRSTRLTTVQQPPLSLPPVQNVVKTMARSIPSLMNPTKSSSMKISATNQKQSGRDDRSDNGHVTRERKQQKISTEANQPHNGSHTSNEPNECIENTPQRRVESKLERSSTFCKERSDINTNELEVID